MGEPEPEGPRGHLPEGGGEIAVPAAEIVERDERDASVEPRGLVDEEPGAGARVGCAEDVDGDPAPVLPVAGDRRDLPSLRGEGAAELLEGVEPGRRLDGVSGDGDERGVEPAHLVHEALVEAAEAREVEVGELGDAVAVEGAREAGDGDVVERDLEPRRLHGEGIEAGQRRAAAGEAEDVAAAHDGQW